MTDTMKHYETNELVMMTFDTIGNETGDGGESSGARDEMFLLDCIKNKPFEEIL